MWGCVVSCVGVLSCVEYGNKSSSLNSLHGLGFRQNACQLLWRRGEIHRRSETTANIYCITSSHNHQQRQRKKDRWEFARLKLIICFSSALVRIGHTRSYLMRIGYTHTFVYTWCSSRNLPIMGATSTRLPSLSPSSGGRTSSTCTWSGLGTSSTS